MTGRDVKHVWNRVQATARIAFEPDNGELVTIYWTYVLDALLGHSWKNKSMADAINLVDDDKEVPPQSVIWVKRIEALCREQSPFAQGAA